MAFFSSLYRFFTVGKGLVCVEGGFRPNGGSGIAETIGSGFTVSRTAIGKYDVTFNEKGMDMVGFFPSVRYSTLSYPLFVFGNTWTKATGVLKLVAMNELVDVGGGTDNDKFGVSDVGPSADAAIYFRCYFKNTGL